MNQCSRCHKIIPEGEMSWDIDGGLCQECWEAYCDEMWWKTGGGVYKPNDEANPLTSKEEQK